LVVFLSQIGGEILYEKMDDIFSLVRDGNALQVRIWLDNTENDLNQGFVLVLLVLLSLHFG